MKWDLLALAALAVGFGVYSLYMGYDSVTIGAVFALLGSIAGYVVGKAQTEA